MKKIILILFSPFFLFSYWEEIKLNLKNENLKRGSPVYFELKEPKSIKIYIENKGSEAELHILKDGKEYKIYKVKEKKEVKLLLEKGNYELRTEEGNFYINVFELKRVNLKSLNLKGFLVTCLINGKKYIYYRITPDTSCSFKLEGPETIYVYVRGDFDRNGKRKYEFFKLKILDNDKEIFSKEFEGKVSKKASYVENKNILPSEVEKVKLELSKGIHLIKILFEKGKGCVKVLCKKKQKFKISFLINSGYDSNVFKFSERDISNFLKGKKLYKFNYVETVDDAFLELNPQIIYSLKDFYFNLSPKLKIFYKNEYKNFGSINFYFKTLKKKEIFFNLYFEPYYFLGPVYIKEEKIIYPLEFSLFKTSFGTNFKELNLKPFFETGIYYYNFYPDFWNYLDGIKYLFSFGINKINFKISCLKPLNPLPDKNYSYISLTPELSLTYKFIKADFQFEMRKFLTKNEIDTIHFKRYDYKINSYLEIKIDYNSFSFYPFINYEQRFVKNPYEGDLLEILKEYKKFLIGIKFYLIRKEKGNKS